MDIIIKRRPVTIPLLPIVAFAVLVLLAFFTARVGRIQGNQIGVLVNNLTGSIEVRTQTGAFLYNGLITDAYTLDNSIQTIRMVRDTGDEVRIKTDDGSDVTMDVEVNYRLVQDATLIRDRVVPESGLSQIMVRDERARELVDAYKAKWVRDYARSVVRYVFGELETGAFYDAARRDARARTAVEELNRLLNPHGIEVREVVPDKFKFYEEYEKIIADQKAADQEVESQRKLAEAALEDQKRRETEATAAANIEIARVKGDLEKELLAAQAEAERETLAAQAYAYSAKQGADAKFYKDTNDAQSMLARAQAQAEGLKKLADSLSGEGGKNVVKLEYATVLQRAVLSGLPYATDPRIQKVEIAPAAGAAGSRGGQR